MNDLLIDRPADTIKFSEIKKGKIMNDENNESMFIDPEILQKELVISLPILNESDIERMINGDETSSDGSTSDDDEKDKPCLKRDQRRLSLLNNPNYGTVLSFMDKFRSYINFKKYPLRIFEDNLINDKEKISGRFMDFHLALLKKISPGKMTERNHFVSNMTKFAYRFDQNDGDHLDEHGYSKAKIDTKLRILKNLLELQFDRNQHLKSAVADKPSCDIRSKPFGRDRLGASYWLFTDTDCFIRLFRENTDADRTWTNLAKNSQELESVIKILISDHAVRKKFPDWKFTNESFNNIPSSNKFEEEYASNGADITKKSEEIEDQSPTSAVLGSTIIKTEHINLYPVVNLDRELSASPPLVVAASVSISNIEVRNMLDMTSDQESIGSEIIKGNRLSISSSSPPSSNDTREEIFSNDLPQESNEKPKNDNNTEVIASSNDIPQESNKTSKNDNNTKVNASSNDTREEIFSNDLPQESNEKPKNDNDTKVIASSNDTREEIFSNDLPQESNETSKNDNNTEVITSSNDIPQESNKTPKNDNNTKLILLKPTVEQGIKRKLVDYDDSESEIESEKNEEPNQDIQPIATQEISTQNTDLPIALRRSRRNRTAFIADSSADSSSTSASQSSKEQKNLNGRWKRSNRSSKTKNSRRHRGRKSNGGFSSTTSDERQPSEEDFSDESPPNNPELDKLLTGELLEGEEEDEDDDHVPRRQAKTVAQCNEPKPCTRCSQTDRPELLLLCEDCNDAYHLECVQPELLSIPEDDWYCPLCEHKRLCDGLIEKLAVLIKDEKDFEMRRRLMVSKRRKRLTNVTVNLERFVTPPEIKKQRTNKRFISSDDEESEKKSNSTMDDNDDKKEIKKKNNATMDDDDVDSVYGCKNDENRKPSDQEEAEQSGKRRVRSCRRKAQNYSLDDYDRKMKEAMIDAGVNKELVDDDSDGSDNIVFKRKSSKKRARYEEDDDFDASEGKNGDADFVPSRRRTINSNSNSNSRTLDEDSRAMPSHSRNLIDDSRSDGRDDYDDYGMSDNDTAWRNRRNSSVSSISKKKSNSKSTSNKNRQSLIISDEDTIPYDPNESEVTPVINIKSEPRTDFLQNEFPTNVFGKTEIVKNVYDKNRIVENVVYTNEAANINKPRRPRRAAAKKPKQKPKIQEENVSDEEEEKSRPPPSRRLPSKKRRGSNDSSLDDDDDYEKAVHKRRLFNHGKAITRSSITGHIKKLLGDEDDEEEEGEENENGEESTKDKSSDGAKKDTNNNNSKQANKNSQFDELRLSDDDDFPDEQEILKTTGLLSLKKSANRPKPIPFQAPFMPSMQSYQFAMVDPTAQFEFTCPSETPITEPSDANQAIGDSCQSTAT